jgi:hypothetical protein
VKITVAIPDTKYCNTCPFLQEVVDSWGYEESHHYCGLLNENLTTSDEEVMNRSLNPRIKKHVKCPSVRRS